MCHDAKQYLNQRETTSAREYLFQYMKSFSDSLITFFPLRIDLFGKGGLGLETKLIYHLP